MLHLGTATIQEEDETHDLDDTDGGGPETADYDDGMEEPEEEDADLTEACDDHIEPAEPQDMTHADVSAGVSFAALGDELDEGGRKAVYRAGAAMRIRIA
jgi:hypothetical protein